MGAVMTDRVARLLELTSAERGDSTLTELEQRMFDGEGLPAICKSWDVPYGRVLNWLIADAGRYARYERALETQAHEMVAQGVQIADEADPNGVPKARLRIDTRFRTARYHAPKVYGEVEAGRVLAQVNVAIGVRVGQAAAPAQ